jgi:hypothetical protein
MIELSNIHPDRFYTDLVSNGVLIEEKVDGSNEDGDLNTFYGFEDAVYEAEEESYTLEAYGTAHIFKDGKIYMVTVHIESNEASGVNELEASEIKDLINELINGEPHEGDADSFYESNAWALAFK